MINRVVVTGAGGFLGGHLMARIHKDWPTAERVAIDRKPIEEWLQVDRAAKNIVSDITCDTEALLANADMVFHCAADMGGMPYIATNNFTCMQDVISTQAILRLGARNVIGRIVLFSSACVYPAALQADRAVPLTEGFATTGPPDSGYGWAKLYCEQMAMFARDELGVDVQIARLFNVYGPHCDTRDPRAKAPAAICRKVVTARIAGLNYVTLFGSGIEVRSFLHIDDCLNGVMSLAGADQADPINFGSDECLTIRQLADIVKLKYDYTGEVRFDGSYPGVKTRIPDLRRAAELVNWHPAVPLSSGIEDLARYVAYAISSN